MSMKTRRQLQVPNLGRVEQWRFGRGTVAWYLKRRKRKRGNSSVVKGIPGLQLWLDAGVGALKSWDAAPASGLGEINYSLPGYTANSNTHMVRVIAFRYVSGVQVFSLGYADYMVTDDGSLNT